MEVVRKDRRTLVAVEVDGHQVEVRYGCRLTIARYGNCVIAG